jgi:molybdenum cofactor cytidylyltransferase
MRARVISGVVLAAGPSTRFVARDPKQLAEIAGEALVLRIVRTALASRLSEVIVVVGYEASRVRAAIAGQSVLIVENTAYSEGQSTSVRAGLSEVDAGAAAAMFIPVDQPDLTGSVLDALIDSYQSTDAMIVVPSFRGRRGAPVLIDRSLFAELKSISGDSGGRQIFTRYEDRIVEVPLSSDKALRDVDRVEDLDRYLGE